MLKLKALFTAARAVKSSICDGHEDCSNVSCHSWRLIDPTPLSPTSGMNQEQIVKKFMLTKSAAVGLAVTLAAIAVPQVASARGELLASRALASWDGPESKLYCADYGWTWGFECKGLKCGKHKWKYCTRNAIDLKRHRIVARMYGPSSITNADQQLKTIANACLVSGLTLAAIPAVITAPLGDTSVSVIKAGISACLKTQNALGGLVTEGFEVTIDEEEFFEH